MTEEQKEKNRHRAITWYYNNKSRALNNVKEYQKNNREKHNLYVRGWVAKNREKRKDILRRSSKKHAKSKQERAKQKYNTDVNWRLRSVLRSRLYQARRRFSKVGSAVNDLGCSITEFKSYLESKFQPGMSWDNYGVSDNKWHIDHIKPLSSFNLSVREEFLKAAHYTNMQPLWALENLIKGNKFHGE